MTFYSPYNFVPLQDPQRLEGVDAALSSGIPLRDGLCGSLAIEMEALTPLLVGGERQKRDGATEVHPFRFPDGTYGVPGSSLHGMLRSIIEAVMGGRMRQVDDRRFALRDFVSTVKFDYAAKMKHAKSGFLRRRPDGQREIVPCEYVLFDHEALKPFGIPADRFGTAEAKLKASSLRHKYDLLEKAFPGLAVEAVDVAPDKTGRMIANALRRGGTGRFVVSAQINEGTVRKPGGKGNGKHHDFVFFDRKDGEAIPVSAEQWRDFLFTHDDDKPGSVRPWPGYWRERHDRGDEVPVFYISDEVGLRFGLARMFRLAGRTSTHDALRFSHPELLEAVGVDLSDALFGTLGDAGAGAARGRVSCTPLVAGHVAPESLGATVLGSPKPSYYPAYLYQPEGEGWKSKWTHWDSAGKDTPRLRGRKRYYAQDKAQLAPPPEKSGENVHTRLFALPTGTVLQGRIVVHNLAPFELGALLWAMELGGHASADHQLGMGKPYGMGRAKLRLRAEECRLRPNVAGEAIALDARLEQARIAFRHFIDARIPGWDESVPVRALLDLSNPTAPRPDKLDTRRYPRLDAKEKKEFDKTDKGPGPLPFTVSGDRMPEVSARQRESEKAAKRAAADAKYGFEPVSGELEADGMLFFKKNEGKLYAVIDKRDHPMPKPLADEVLGKLSNKAKEKATDRKLAVVFRYTVLGNSYTVMACELKQ
jgi:CRISPR-associated protein (TIGR03986 family)